MSMRIAARRLRAVAAALGGIAIVIAGASGRGAAQVRPDQLVMFREAGCPFCAQWDRDVGKLYAKTDEAKSLPIREVNLLGPRPVDLSEIKDLKYTPTFVVTHCGKELARITGYLGPDQFWGLLDRDITDLKAAPPCAS